MTHLKKITSSAALALVLGLGGLAASFSTASAYVVCNAEGDCWHTDRRYHYDPALGVIYHPDDWYFHQHWDDHHHWRDYHDGRGYWRGGQWHPF
jgi:hypothetical protein